MTNIFHVLTHSIEIYNLTPDKFSQYDAYIHIFCKITRELGYDSYVGYLATSVSDRRVSIHKYGHLMIAYPVVLNKGRFGYEVSNKLVLDVLRNDIDIIHVHSYYLLMHDIIALAVKGSESKCDKKIVAHYHGGNPSMLLSPLRILKAITLRLADKIIAINRAEVHRLINFWKIPREKVVYIPNAVDTSFFKPINSMKIDNIVLYVGNLVKDKGVDVLIKAFLKCKKKIPELQLYVVGEGRLRPLLEKVLRLLGLSSSIKFLGRVTHEELIRLYNMASLTILPSKKEALPFVLLESMACETPVIATATEGAVDIISHGEDGFLVPVGNAKKLADAICTIINNPELREQMGKKAREKVERKFSWNTIKMLLKEVYTSLTE